MCSWKGIILDLHGYLKLTGLIRRLQNMALHGSRPIQFWRLYNIGIVFKSSKYVISSVEIVHNDNWRERPWWYSEFHQNHFQKWRWNCIFRCLHGVVLMVHSVKTNASSESKSELIRCIVLCRQINKGCWFALVKTTYWTNRICFSSYFSRFLRISPFLDYANLPFFWMSFLILPWMILLGNRVPIQQ